MNEVKSKRVRATLGAILIAFWTMTVTLIQPASSLCAGCSREAGDHGSRIQIEVMLKGKLRAMRVILTALLYFLEVRMKFEGKIKSIRVKVESIETGEIVKDFDCGTNERKAEKLEDSLTERTNLDKYHVYQSVEI